MGKRRNTGPRAAATAPASSRSQKRRGGPRAVPPTSDSTVTGLPPGSGGHRAIVTDDLGFPEGDYDDELDDFFRGDLGEI